MFNVRIIIYNLYCRYIAFSIMFSKMGEKRKFVDFSLKSKDFSKFIVKTARKPLGRERFVSQSA